MHERWAADDGLTMTLVSDPERAVIRTWGVYDAGNDTAWPTIYVVGADGRIAWRGTTDDYRERPSPQRILEALP